MSEVCVECKSDYEVREYAVGTHGVFDVTKHLCKDCWVIRYEEGNRACEEVETGNLRGVELPPRFPNFYATPERIGGIYINEGRVNTDNIRITGDRIETDGIRIERDRITALERPVEPLYGRPGGIGIYRPYEDGERSPYHIAIDERAIVLPQTET